MRTVRSSAKLLAGLVVGAAALSGCIVRTSPGYYSTTGGATVIAGSPGYYTSVLQIGGSQANFGYVTMGPGFTPDPVNVNVVSGGVFNARNMGLPSGCIGWVTRTPDYIVRFTGYTQRLRFFVQSQADTTLVINAANGTWHCNDDAVGRNPVVDIIGAQPGQYDIWVGSYRQGERAVATLSMTELNYGPGM
jgi:hypothetical protein